MTRRTDQHGFSVGIVAAALLVVLVIGGVGYVVLKPGKSTDTTGTAPASTPNPAPHTDTANDDTKVSQPHLLEIKEWGVTVPLPDTIKDAYYVTRFSSTDNDGTINTAYISLTSLQDTNCDVATTGGPTDTLKPVGGILRVLPDDREPVDGRTYKVLYPDGVMLDGHYYVYVPWAGADCAPKETLKTINDAFKEAVKHAYVGKR